MPSKDRERRIRELARAIWEQEGRPEERAERHWHMAEKAVEAAERAEVEVSMDSDARTNADFPTLELNDGEKRAYP